MNPDPQNLVNPEPVRVQVNKIRVAPDTDLAGYSIWPDIWLNSKNFSFEKNVPLFKNFKKSAYSSLLYIDIILFVKLFFILNSFLAEYPAGRISSE